MTAPTPNSAPSPTALDLAEHNLELATAEVHEAFAAYVIARNVRYRALVEVLNLTKLEERGHRAATEVDRPVIFAEKQGHVLRMSEADLADAEEARRLDEAMMDTLKGKATAGYDEPLGHVNAPCSTFPFLDAAEHQRRQGLSR